jgi:hypothetical protein
MLMNLMRGVGIAGPAGVNIPLSTVSLGTSFDAYLDAGFAGSASGPHTALLLDSGNSVLVMPRWEDITSIPNWQQSYKVLGQAEEPWGCPSNVVQGPIQLATDTGEPFTLSGCVFLACTADSPSTGTRTANFGAGCITPWGASGWNTPDHVPITIKSPLAYATAYPFAEFDYAAAAEVFAATNPQGVSETSTLRLYSAAPANYQFLQILPNCPWMALRPRKLQIEDHVTAWPDPTQAAIAMIDTGGTCVYLSDPTDLVYGNTWPAAVDNPSWTNGSTNCVSTKASLIIGLADDQGSAFSYGIDENQLPSAAQGLTLVMCQANEFMMGQYGMNIGGLSALTVRILIDYNSGTVGFRSL